MNQVAFAFKLKWAIDTGIISKEQLDKEVEVADSSMKWSQNLFHDRNDLAILADNTVKMSLATLAIAADEELNNHLGPKQHDKTQFPNNVRAIIYQIRNAYAHTPLVPVWDVAKRSKKSYSYESGGASICLDFQRLHGQPIDWSQFNGFDNFWALFEQAQSLVVSARSPAVPPVNSTAA